MMYEENGEVHIELAEDDVEESIAYLTDLAEAMEKNDKTKNNKKAIGCLHIAVETMMAFCMQNFDLEDDE